MRAGLRSGQVAEAAGVNIQTLRCYERRGLLAEPDRSNSGHRLYGEDAGSPTASAARGRVMPVPVR
ncbi:MerR family DNA-binding transcriptional regulator [Streptomyces sp. NPDC005180]|uniref:MerR family DNA-binding transcriptional regulator n=1 Tax=Streptomyces sp. NPDC005180 TaxID=3156868 RepID=UPI0033BD9F6E